MGITGMFGLINAGLNITNGLRTSSAPDTSSSGYNEFGPYLQGADPADEAFTSAENFLKDNPLLAAMFPDTDQLKKDGAKLQDFEMKKLQEFQQAKELTEAKIDSARESYYDDELEKKLEAFRKDNDPSTINYEGKKDLVIHEHKEWVRKRELELLERKQKQENQIRDDSIKRRDEFFTQFQELSKEGFTPEANKKRAELAKKFAEQEDGQGLKDQQTLLRAKAFGFPPDSDISAAVDREVENFSQIYDSYKLPNGKSVPKDVKDAYFRMEERQKEMEANIEKWSNGDLSFMDQAEGKMAQFFEQFKGDFENVMSSEQIGQINDMITRQRQIEKSQPQMSLDLNQFKFDPNTMFGNTNYGV